MNNHINNIMILILVLISYNSFSQEINNQSIKILEGSDDDALSVNHIKYIQCKDTFNVEAKKAIKYENLEFLEISCTNTEEIPKELFNFKKLKKLYIYSFGRKIIIPKEIKNLKKLEFLLIDGAKLEKSINLKSLENLSEVVLSRCVISKRVLKQLKNVRILKINYCELNNIPPIVFDLKKIEKLDLSHNKINQITEKVLKLETLRELVILDNKIDAIPSYVFDMSSLVLLDISGNNVASIKFPINKKTMLKFLILHSNPIINNSAILDKIPKTIEVITVWK